MAEPITADEILAAMFAALKEFGEYSFADKGAREAMDLPAIDERLAVMPPPDVIAVLEAVYRTRRKTAFARQLVSELVCNMDATDKDGDARWEALMTSKILQES